MLSRISAAVVSRAQSRSKAAALVASALILVVAVFMHRDLLVRVSDLPALAHSAISLDQAVNGSVCGRAGLLSKEFDIALDLSRRPEALRDSLRQTIQRLAGSSERYCASVLSPYQNNENSLMLSMRALLWVDRDAPPARLAHELTILRLVMLGVFLFALIVSGIRLVWCLVLALLAVAILDHLAAYDLTSYPFLLTLPLLNVGFYTLLRRSDHVRQVWYAVIVGVAAGILTGFTSNMRSTHLILCLAMFVMFIVSTMVAPRRPEDRARVAAVAASIAFVAGLVVFNSLLISPLSPTETSNSTNYSYHAVMHPIVLGLANPANDLSRREGIVWSDPVGLTLARRVDPAATYLGPTYESALRTYYLSLWGRYPGEMLRLYLVKLSLAGNGIFDTMSRILLRYGVPSAPVGRLDSVVNGWMLFAITVAEFALAWRWYLRSHSSLAFALSLVSLSAGLVLLECAAITATFYPSYSSLVLFNVFVAATALAHLVADYSYDLATKALSRLHALSDG